MKAFLVAETATCLDGLNAFLSEIGALGKWATNASSGGETVIEVMGRLCYKSFSTELNANLTKVREGNREYISNILKSRHGSVIEHSSVSFILTGVSRILTHELVRHRAGVAISQESQRFVRLDEFDMYIPDLDDAFRLLVQAIDPDLEEDKVKAEASLLAADYLQAIDNVKRTSINALRSITQYLDRPGVSFEIKKQITSALRRFVPGGVNTNIGITANHRAWRHMIAMRTAPSAEVEIREAFNLIVVQLKARYPALYQDMERVRTGNIISYTFQHDKV